MDAIYRCKTTDNKVVEVDADTFDSVGIIKGLCKIVHNVDVVEVLNEIQVSKKHDDVPITRLPDSLRSFIDTKMAGAKHLVCHFSSYVMRNGVKPNQYRFILKAMLDREKEEADERELERLSLPKSADKMVGRKKIVAPLEAPTARRGNEKI